LSYEVGSDSLVPGIDEAITGLSAGEAKTFTTTLRDGREARASVTVRSVKQKELPELDDDFAQTASEFDTIEELRADVRERLERIRRLTQGVEARDKVLDALLSRVEVPMPEHVLGDEVAFRRQSLDRQLEAAGLTKDAYASSEDKSVEDIDAEIEDGARQALKSQFVLDAIAAKEELGVNEAELTDQIVRRAQRSGMRAEDYAREVVSQGQLPALMAEVMRGKALALVLEHAKITDTAGNPVDLDALTPEVAPQVPETDAAAVEEPVEAEVVVDSEVEPEVESQA
jgi:trigger factor